jgi:hypothetical protein
MASDTPMPLLPGNAYLQSLGLASPPPVIPAHMRLAYDIHVQWRRLRDYWFESPSKDCGALNWVGSMNRALLMLMHRNDVSVESLRRLFTLEVMARTRRAIRRRPANVDKTLPGQVADAIGRLLYFPDS